MAAIDHWHPVLLSSHLRRNPVSVRLDGRDIVLFRTGDQVGALRDLCPHRRMKLSLGQVVGDRLQCRYHGWTYDACGRGESPGTPKLHASAEAYDACETQGAVWVKSRDSRPVFPPFDVAGHHPMGVLAHQVRAPLELVVDNFCEIEHTPTTHAVFGYELKRMHEVQVRFEPTDTTVRVVNHGPQKQVGPLLRWMLGITPRFHFNDDWTTHFSPVYSIYDHWWSDPGTGRESMVRWRLFIFFTPMDERTTSLMTFAFIKSRWPFGPEGAVRPFKGMMRRMLDREILLDVEILEGLASQETGLDGMKLSRFDRVLGLNRERIERVYRGRPAAALA